MTKDAGPVPRFERTFFESDHSLTRIGSGGLGGKATGLVHVESLVLSKLSADDFPYIEISIPKAVVLTTDVYDAFMQRNDLADVIESDLPDDRIAHAFQRAEFPAEFVGDLRALISSVHTPLAVRSSSQLEDALDHPFAGVYGTKMIPNNEIEEDERFRRLEEAIKFVYSTALFAESRAYLRSVGLRLEDEKMAVMIQEVVGQRAGDRFYPCISGVARSHNFYPTGHGTPADGVINLALGLGKTIVDGGLSWHYTPAYPTAPPPFNDVGDLIKNTQTSFWAVEMGAPPPHDPVRETERMVLADLAAAEDDGALGFLVSTYDPGSDRLNSGLDVTGARVLTFAPILGSRFVPFNDALRRLLELAEHALDGPVEIEFAVNLHREDLLPARIGFLQLRPMLVNDETTVVETDELGSTGAVVSSDRVLGNGSRDDIVDAVFLDPESFDRALTPTMALELDRINRTLIEEDRHYLLIGFGRWGTSDPWLGVPVAWGQISGARVIVEATLPDVNPDLSQGSHFFHNLLACRVLYLSVLHDGPLEIDWGFLRSQTIVNQRRFATHVRLTEPFDIRVDGSSGRGVVIHNDSS